MDYSGQPIKPVPGRNACAILTLVLVRPRFSRATGAVDGPYFPIDAALR